MKIKLGDTVAINKPRSTWHGAKGEISRIDTARDGYWYRPGVDLYWVKTSFAAGQYTGYTETPFSADELVKEEACDG